MYDPLERFWEAVAGGGDIKNATAPACTIEMGSIGWDDADEHAFLGEDSNDGFTLIRVQLYRGRDITQPLNPDRAQGHKVVCQIGSGVFRVPPKDARCFVIMPRGMEHLPGAGVIVSVVEKSPTDQFAKDRVVMDFGAETHVVIRAKSISLQDPESRFLTVGTPRAGGDPGIWLQAADGSGGAISEGKVGLWVSDGSDAQTILQMTPSEVKCMKKSGGYWGVDASGFNAFGATCAILGGAVYAKGTKTFIGLAPIEDPTSAAIAFGAGPPAFLPSPSVYISKT